MKGCETLWSNPWTESPAALTLGPTKSIVQTESGRTTSTITMRTSLGTWTRFRWSWGLQNFGEWIFGELRVLLVAQHEVDSWANDVRAWQLGQAGRRKTSRDQKKNIRKGVGWEV